MGQEGGPRSPQESIPVPPQEPFAGEMIITPDEVAKLRQALTEAKFDTHPSFGNLQIAGLNLEFIPECLRKLIGDKTFTAFTAIQAVVGEDGIGVPRHPHNTDGEIYFTLDTSTGVVHILSGEKEIESHRLEEGTYTKVQGGMSHKVTGEPGKTLYLMGAKFA